jgi:N6-adenosine-specific RNA methylase IME4
MVAFNSTNITTVPAETPVPLAIVPAGSASDLPAPPGTPQRSVGIFGDLPRGHFGAGIADPGWHYGTYSDKGRGKCADRKYRCQRLDEIKALPVGELFKLDAAIALWLPQYGTHWAEEALWAWGGFTPRSMGTWVKLTAHGKWFFGQGKVLRSACEFYVIGVRGHPPVRSHSVRNLIVAPWRGHSVKPDQLHIDIEQLYDGPYVELFARRHYPGWAAWATSFRNS